jgi:DNA polymerase elongation subunit (family B)
MSIDLERLRLTKDKDLLKEFSGYTRERLRELKKELPTRIPKILVFDIETAPLEVWTWGLYNQNIGINQIKNDWFTLNWAAKWLFDDVMMTGVLTKKELLEKDDKRIVKKAWDLFNQAEIVLAHNGDRFDIAKINSRFLKHDLKLPSPYQSIDTLKIARQAFRLTSNKLDYICKYLGLKGKIQTGGFELWKNCINGDMKSLKKMNEYCQNDVIILEEMYLKLRPYAKGHPNLALYMESDYEVCPNCGSDKLKWGYLYYTKVNTYECARCENCGAYMRVRKNNTKNKDLLLTN